MKNIAWSIFLMISVSLHAQQGRLIRYASAYAMFPDTARAKGHDYNGKHYDAATHYSDSSILIYIPAKYKPERSLRLVFWFHGWGNNIDSACRQYALLEQVEASGHNLVFVFPEGPKNAPDSYGGKLEQPPVFQALVSEVLGKLKKEHLVKNNARHYAITLAGHSGAYRVISRIINQTPVDEVILFDAMYGGNEAYLQWLSDPAHRFINIYTKEGGTFDNSQWIMKQLNDSLHIPFVKCNEEDVKPAMLSTNQKLFIYSSKGHNEVITNNRNWERFLRYVPVKK